MTPTLADAADFLIIDVCAEKVALYRQYVTNVRMLQQLQSGGTGDDSEEAQRPSRALAARQRASLMATIVDPNTAAITPPPPTTGSVTAIEITGYGEAMFTLEQPYLRAVAARAILDARRAH